MEETKHDLSAGLVKLDYQALYETSRAALYSKIREIENSLDILKKEVDPIRTKDLTPMLYIQAQSLAWEAKNLKTISETYYTLHQGLTREEVKITNKPEVPIEVEYKEK